MRRAVVLAHHDPHGILDPHVARAIVAYRRAADRIVVVSTSVRVLPREVAGVVDTFLPRDNVGYDFGSWRDGLATLSPRGGFDAPGFDEVVCVNDSVYGPLRDIRPALADARTADADLWGMVLSRQPPRGGGRAPRPHLQSWFFAARRPLLDAVPWRRFWEAVVPLPTKAGVVARYELGLSESVAAAGFRVAALHEAPVAAPPWGEIAPHLSPRHPGRAWRLLRKSRAALHNPAELRPGPVLAAGVPFVKVSVFRVNHYGLDPRVVRSLLAAAADGYDPSLVDAHLSRTAGPVPVDWKAGDGVR